MVSQRNYLKVYALGSWLKPMENGDETYRPVFLAVGRSLFRPAGLTSAVAATKSCVLSCRSKLSNLLGPDHNLLLR